MKGPSEGRRALIMTMYMLSICYKVYISACNYPNKIVDNRAQHCKDSFLINARSLNHYLFHRYHFMCSWILLMRCITERGKPIRLVESPGGFSYRSSTVGLKDSLSLIFYAQLVVPVRQRGKPMHTCGHLVSFSLMDHSFAAR